MCRINVHKMADNKCTVHIKISTHCVIRESYYVLPQYLGVPTYVIYYIMVWKWHMIIRVVGISRDYERGIQSVHRSGARRAKKGLVNP